MSTQRKQQQYKLFSNSSRAYGGALRSTRKGRGARPLSGKQSIHLTLRSTKAVGSRSLRRHHSAIKHILSRQTQKARIKLYGWANVGNHLHLHIKLPNDVFHRREYRRFIRAVTGLIARKTLSRERGVARASSLKQTSSKQERFWDLRPFTRVLTSWREFQVLRDYIKINYLEARGIEKALAREMVRPSILVEDG